MPTRLLREYELLLHTEPCLHQQAHEAKLVFFLINNKTLGYNKGRLLVRLGRECKTTPTLCPSFPTQHSSILFSLESTKCGYGLLNDSNRGDTEITRGFLAVVDQNIHHAEPTVKQHRIHAWLRGQSERWSAQLAQTFTAALKQCSGHLAQALSMTTQYLIPG